MGVSSRIRTQRYCTTGDVDTDGPIIRPPPPRPRIFGASARFTRACLSNRIRAGLANSPHTARACTHNRPVCKSRINAGRDRVRGRTQNSRPRLFSSVPFIFTLSISTYIYVYVCVCACALYSHAAARRVPLSFSQRHIYSIILAERLSNFYRIVPTRFNRDPFQTSTSTVTASSRTFITRTGNTPR